MHLSSRTAASSVLGFTLAMVVTMGVTSVVGSTTRSQPQAFDDTSDFDGTKCASGQLFDATNQQCVSAVVTNDPQAPVQPNSAGMSDPGKPCPETQDYVVSDQKCMSDVVTNNPHAVVAIEGEDPTEYTAPKVAAIPDCAAKSDPLGLCS